jgi:DNA mismatch repair ATPase MutS
MCFPSPAPPEGDVLSANGLYDVSLALVMEGVVVGNDFDADGKHLIMITGANQGGKSTFLRSVGLAQLMMQSGMFVGATDFRANTMRGVFTHYRREEDPTMVHGKLDEELVRMSEIVDLVTPGCLLLCNESFASTNEREGSEIARQVVRAMTDFGVKVVFVTHMYELARALYAERSASARFLCAERRDDGHRTFRVIEGPPIPTSFGEDLYAQIIERKAPSGLPDGTEAEVQ